MKRFILLSLALMLFMLVLVTGIPNKMSVQGQAFDSGDNVLTGEIDMHFYIECTTQAWDETQAITADSNGVYFATLGDTNLLNITANESCSFFVEFNDNGRMQEINFTSVLYAYNAERLDCMDDNCNFTNVNATNVTSTGTLLGNFIGAINNFITKIFASEIVVTTLNITDTFFFKGSNISNIVQSLENVAWVNQTNDFQENNTYQDQLILNDSSRINDANSNSFIRFDNGSVQVRLAK